VQRREDDDRAKRILETDAYGEWSRGRQRERWIDIIKFDLEKLRLAAVDAEDHAEWRRNTRLADPSTEGFQPKGERGGESSAYYHR